MNEIKRFVRDNCIIDSEMQELLILVKYNRVNLEPSKKYFGIFLNSMSELYIENQDMYDEDDFMYNEVFNLYSAPVLSALYEDSYLEILNVLKKNKSNLALGGVICSSSILLFENKKLSEAEFVKIVESYITYCISAKDEDDIVFNLSIITSELYEYGFEDLFKESLEKIKLNYWDDELDDINSLGFDKYKSLELGLFKLDVDEELPSLKNIDIFEDITSSTIQRLDFAHIFSGLLDVEASVFDKLSELLKEQENVDKCLYYLDFYGAKLKTLTKNVYYHNTITGFVLAHFCLVNYTTVDSKKYDDYISDNLEIAVFEQYSKSEKDLESMICFFDDFSEED